MNGINLLLDSNHINKGNVFKAAQQVTALNLSANSLNYYISEAIDIEAEKEHGFELPKIEDAETAKRILAYMVQAAIPKRIEKFDLKAYNVFRSRVGLPVIEFEVMGSDMVMETSTPSFYESVSMDLDDDLPSVEEPEVPNETPSIVFDIEKPTMIERVASEALSDSVTKAKTGRGRRSNPNSAINVAKRLYQESADKSRDVILKLFQEKLGLESGTAMTYYYMARK